MKDNFQNLLNKYLGKPCEVSDPSNLNQCFDLAYTWMDEIKVTRDAIRHLYASQIWTNPNDLTVKFFEMIPNTAMFTPQVGDICVFKGGTAGHVSIATGIGDTNNFQSFDQNWGTTVNKCGYITHTYDSLLGVLRLRQSIPIAKITNQTLLPIIDENGNQMEVQAVRSRLADGGTQITNLKLTVTSLNTQITDLQTKLNDIPVTESGLLRSAHDVLWGKDYFWIKLSKLKVLLPR